MKTVEYPKMAVEILPDGTTFEMIRVAGGSFMMGSDQETIWERPIHPVDVPNFWLGKYPVTQKLWQAVMGRNPALFKGSMNPVEWVSWNDVQNFIQKLNDITGEAYRLPSESKWEFAARGGNLSQGLRFSGSSKLKEVGWYALNSHRETKTVGLKSPNELGLHDMNGNVWEWCADYWHDDYEGAPDNGSSWVREPDYSTRVVRGGSWYINANGCSVSIRLKANIGHRKDDMGFRLARY